MSYPRCPRSLPRRTGGGRIQGAAFAGKTALLAWFALHPPPAVDLAACFLRRTDGTATAEYALDVLNQQLAVLAERGAYAPAAHLSEQRDDFLDYLKAAAQTARERGHRLVVVVDGLDEDQTPNRTSALPRGCPTPGSCPTMPGFS